MRKPKDLDTLNELSKREFFTVEDYRELQRSYVGIAAARLRNLVRQGILEVVSPSIKQRVFDSKEIGRKVIEPAKYKFINIEL